MGTMVCSALKHNYCLLHASQLCQQGDKTQILNPGQEEHQPQQGGKYTPRPSISTLPPQGATEFMHALSPPTQSCLHISAETEEWHDSVALL